LKTEKKKQKNCLNLFSLKIEKTIIPINFQEDNSKELQLPEV